MPLYRTFPIALGVVVIAAAMAVILSRSHGSDASDPTGLPSGAASNTRALAGLDVAVGSAYVSIEQGTDVSTLSTRSPVIVIATVRSADIVEKPVEIDVDDIPWPTGGPGTPAPGDDPKGGPPEGSITWGLYSTRYTLEVEEVIESVGRDPRSAISILQGGAIVDGVRMGYENIPMYTPGERYLLFLVPNTGKSPDDFSSASGPYGSFLLMDGKVYRSFGEHGKWVPDDASSEADLLTSVREAVARE